MIIDATDLILGRMCAKAAKQALLGQDVAVVNCEQALVTGNKKDIIAMHAHRLQRGQPQKGPFIQRKADRFVRRVIRGMLPFHQDRGRTAYARVKCYIGLPEAFAGQKAETVKGAAITKVQNLKYITVKEICRQLGGK